LYEATHVPVGEDQKQHLELTRNIAQRFNGLYGDVFVIPEPVIPAVGARIMDLQNPENKMSKSEDSSGTISLLDTPAQITKKIKRAVTDNVGKVGWDKEHQAGVTNLLSIYCSCYNVTPAQALEVFQNKGYGDVKVAVAEAV